jgi:hypothetical protein
MTQEQKYTVETTYPEFEVRRYESCVLADVTIDSSFESAGSSAFGSLFGYISGGNTPTNTKIAMTSPVLQESSGTSNIVSFVMLAGMGLDTLPLPTNSRVTLRPMPEQIVAVARFGGRWTEANYQRQLLTLKNELERNGYATIGNPRYARFDPPWTPWFMRRNEIQIPIATPTQ